MMERSGILRHVELLSPVGALLALAILLSVGLAQSQEKPVSSWRIRALIAPGTRAESVQLKPHGKVDAEITIASDGDIVVRGEPPLLVRISAMGRGEVDVSLCSAFLAMPYVPIVLPESTRLSGLLVGDDGRPVSGARVRVCLLPTVGSRGLLLEAYSMQPREARTGEDGRFVFTGLPRHTPVSLSVVGAQGARVISLVTSREDVRIQLRSLSGTVVEEKAQRALEGGRVFLARYPSGGEQEHALASAPVNAQGRFRFAAVIEGGYSARYEADSGRPVKVVGSRRFVAVDGPGAEVVIEARSLVREGVRGRVLTRSLLGVASASVYAVSPKGRARVGVTNGSGYFEGEVAHGGQLVMLAVEEKEPYRRGKTNAVLRNGEAGILLNADCSITGTVSGGEPGGRGMLFLERDENSGWESAQEALPSHDGRFVGYAFRPGVYTVVFLGKRDRIGFCRAELLPGVNELHVETEGARFLSLVNHDSSARRVLLTNEKGTEAIRLLICAGSQVITRVKPGATRVMARKASTGEDFMTLVGVRDRQSVPVVNLRE